MLVLSVFLVNQLNAQMTVEVSASLFDFPLLDGQAIGKTNQFNIVVNNVTDKDDRLYKLEMSIEGQGITIRPNRFSSVYVDFNSSSTVFLNSSKISHYFDIENLDLSGFTKESYYRNGLPEGLYKLCFNIVDVTSDSYQNVSNNACLNLWVVEELPPRLESPSRNNSILDINSNIYWTPNHSNISPVNYEVSIFESHDGVSSTDLLTFYTPLISTKVFTTDLPISRISKSLKNGTEYQVVVKAKGVTNHIRFKNEGYSEIEKFVYKAPLAQIRSSSSQECLPSTQVFINEIGNGKRSSVNEFIELVVVGGSSEGDLVDLSNIIIDDNNFAEADVGNESGHIRLGDCFEAMPRGAIILIYDNKNVNSLINPQNDGFPNSEGFYQLPISSDCIEKFPSCPNHEAGNSNYNCSTVENAEWRNLIPMDNYHDIIQLRTEDSNLEHAIIWGTQSNEFFGTLNVIDKSDISPIYDKSIAFTEGEDWNDADNYNIIGYNVSTPGYANSTDNQEIIDIIKDYEVNPSSFFIDCELEYLGITVSIKINVHDDPIGVYEVYLNGEHYSDFEGDLFRITDVEEGAYSIKVINKLTGCESTCTQEVDISCPVGMPCTDFDNCTENDVYDEFCICIGEPILDIDFNVEDVFAKEFGYCTTIIPEGESLINSMDVFEISLTSQTGEIYILNADLNSTAGNSNQHIFDFPYTLKANQSIFRLRSHLYIWFWSQGYDFDNLVQFPFQSETPYFDCEGDVTLEIYESSLIFNEIKMISNLGDVFVQPFIESEAFSTSNIIGSNVTAVPDCESPTDFVWSNGDLEQSIFVPLGVGCYEVSVTCDGECGGVATYGDNCDCPEGGEANVCCVVGTQCIPETEDCYIEAFWDYNCNCVPVPGFDLDGDGNCDEDDMCQGHDDHEDFDNDGIPDGCDICNSTDISDADYLDLVDAHLYQSGGETTMTEYEYHVVLEFHGGFLPSLSSFPCDEIPCPEIDISFNLIEIGQKTCSYCIDLSNFENTTDYNLYFKSIVGSVDQEEKKLQFLTDWDQKFYSNFDSDADQDQWTLSQGSSILDNEDIAVSGTYSLLLSNSSAATQISHSDTEFNSCQIEMEFNVLGYKLTSGTLMPTLTLEIRNSNQGWTHVKTWEYLQDFSNEVTQLSVYIDGEFDQNSEVRLRSNIPDDNGAIFIDNVFIKSVDRNENIDECLQPMDDLSEVVILLENWMQSANIEGIVETHTNGNQLCGTEGLTITIDDTNMAFQSMQIVGGDTNIQIPFYSWDCDSNDPGQLTYTLDAEVDCDDAEYLWSNGETTQSIDIPVLASYQVTVTCENECTGTSIFTNPEIDCVFGEDCIISTTNNLGQVFVCEGVLDEYCNCIDIDFESINNGTNDSDNDGIINCQDPCYGPNIDENENGILDCQECVCLFDPELSIIPKSTKIECSTCVDISSAAINKLINVRVVYQGSAINLQNTEGFNFPYQYDVIEYDQNNPATWSQDGMNNFTADFYNWINNVFPDEYTTVSIIKDPQENCAGSDYALEFDGLHFGVTLYFNFENTPTIIGEQQCEEVPVSFALELDVSNCESCSDDQGNARIEEYLWSDGSTDSEPYNYLESTVQGYAVTITCGEGCEFVVLPNWDYDCIIGEACDDSDNCTSDDEISLGNPYNPCWCQGIPDSVDDDNDGIADNCDVCPGYDDSVDTDADGVPNGCDECPGYNDALLNDPTFDQTVCIGCDDSQTITLYNSTIEVPFNLSECGDDPTFLQGFTANLPGYDNVTVNNYPYGAGLLHFDYCILPDDCNTSLGTTPIIEFGSHLQNWLDFMGFGGTVNVTFVFPSQWRVTIENSEAEFLELNFGCQGVGSIREDDDVASARGGSGSLPFDTQSTENNPDFGGPCDDGYECTVFDIYDENCVCSGVYIDSDEDTVCDANDQCPDWPDYMGCSRYCEDTNVTVCEYFENVFNSADRSDQLTSSPKVIMHSLRDLHCKLDEIINNSPVNFNIPGAMNDDDGDGYINILDINDEDSSVPSGNYYTLSEIQNNCNESTNFETIAHNNALRYLLFEVVNYVYDENNINEECIYEESNFTCGTQPNVSYFTPGCAIELGIEVEEDQYCNLVSTSTGCRVEFSIDCYGNCMFTEYELGAEIKQMNGECPDDVVVLGCDINCPDTECTQYQIIINPDNPSDCECELVASYDEDEDGVCDEDDECPGHDDSIDVDSDGVPDGCDDCLVGSVGDPCNDGNPCTYADVVISTEEGCKCAGQIFDNDNDGVIDCEDCESALDNDGDGYVDEVLIKNLNELFDCADDDLACLERVGQPVLLSDGTYADDNQKACDVCPGLDDTVDTDGDGIPDCLDAPLYEIGCPADIVLIADQGVLLIWPSDDLEIEDLPQPISLTTISEGSNTNNFNTEDYLLYSNVREVDGSFEVFYPLTSIADVDNMMYTAVTFSDHQPCVLDGDNPLSELNCPSSVSTNFVNGQQLLILDFNLPDGYDFDFASITGDLIFDPPIDGTSGTQTVRIGSGILNPEDQGQLTMTFDNISGLQNFGNYDGNIILPNGISCPVSNGSTSSSCTDSDGNDVTVGDPCDDGKVCTHHDKWVESTAGECECIGEDKPDSDGDNGAGGLELCDEVDPCPDDANDENGDCPCTDITLSPIGLVSGNDFELELDMSIAEEYQDMTVVISGGPEEVTMEAIPYSSPLVVPNLDYGYTYVITVTGTCLTGATSSASVGIDVPFLENQFFCGVSLDPVDLTSFTLLPQLSKGDMFTASDFEINVRQATGSYGSFKGKGYISLPYLNFVRINVTFDDITIANNMQMIQGHVDVDGYGLAILGDDLSDAINDAANDIINVLTDISSILEELIPMLEEIEDLVETTGHLVSEEAKNCILLAQEDLDGLKLLAESDNPPDNIVEQIKIATAALELCHEEYEEELATILNKLVELMDHSVTQMLIDCGGEDDLMEDAYNAILGSPANPETQLNAYLDNMLANLNVASTPQGGATDGQEEYTQTTITDYLSEDFITSQEMEDYLEAESNYTTCELINRLNELGGFPYTEESDLLESINTIKVILTVFLTSGDDLVQSLGEALRSDDDAATIYEDADNKELIKESFRKSVQVVIYQN